MSKTTILIDQYDSQGVALNGYVLIKLSNPVVDQDTNKTYLPAISRVELVGGQGSIALENSATAGQQYTFSIYQYGQAQASELIWEFKATVPASLTPIKWTDLITQTGISEDNQDSSFQAIIRGLYYNDGFWVKLQQTFYPRKGNYSATATYTFGQVVYYQGNLYSSVSSVPIAGKDPISNPTLWQIFSQKGDTGAGTTGDNSPYDATAWNTGNSSTTAPSKQSVRNVIETLETKAVVASKVSSTNAVLTAPTLASSPLASDNSGLVPSTSWVRNLVFPTAKAINPIGMPAYWVTPSAPQYWVMYDGRTLSTTTYADLFAVLGTLYNIGNEVSGTFRVPDLRGRVMAGLDNMSTLMGAANVIPTLTTLGFRGGTATHSLSLAELPAHTHNTAFAPSNAGTGTPNSVVAALGSGTNIATSSTGSGTAHNNLQPYMGLYVIGFANV